MILEPRGLGLLALVRAPGLEVPPRLQACDPTVLLSPVTVECQTGDKEPVTEGPPQGDRGIRPLCAPRAKHLACLLVF